MKDPHKQCIITHHHNRCQKQMQLVHNDQIPGICIVKAVAKYQEKSSKTCGNPDAPWRNAALLTDRCLLKKEQYQKCQQSIPIGKYRKNIFQLLDRHGKNIEKSTLCSFCTDTAQIRIERNHECHACQYSVYPVFRCCIPNLLH